MLLYIHIPFCDSKCHYCAFNSYTYLHNYRKKYLNALLLQLKTQLKNHNKKIETVFIGGGTPSTIDGEAYSEILSVIEPYFIDKNIEITIEANPNSASIQWLKAIKKAKINRVSFGVQSFDDDKLQFLGRNHNKTQAIEAIKNAKNIGFEHINCDIIYDTKLDTKKLLQNDLDIIKTLPIDHISAYSLTLEEGTKFFHTTNVQVENEHNARYLFESLKQMGFVQYEISNFAYNDEAKSKHNLGYWQYKEYLGIGSGAVGCVNNQRVYNQSDLLQYIKNPLVYADMESLSSNDIVMEKLLLGLRSEVGVQINILNRTQKQKVFNLAQMQKIIIQDNKLYARDFMLADELALYIEE